METISDLPSLKMLWMAVSGQTHVPPMMGSVMIYSVTFLFCLLLQYTCRRFLPQRLHSYAADFCVTMLICCFPYGHGAMRANYGHVGYLVSAVTMVTVTLLVFEGVPSPLGVFVRYVQGEESVWGLGVRVGLQVMAAFMSYRLVFAICCVQLTKDHEMLLQGSCESDLKVPVMVGCLIEFSSVLYDTWLGYQQLFRTRLLDTVVKNINGALLVCAGVHLTGMYMHPAMATAMTFNCQGTNAFEHISVYWMAAFLGCFAGVKLRSVLSLPTGVQPQNGDVMHGQGDRGQKKRSSNGHLKERQKKRASAQGERLLHSNNNIKLTKRHKKDN